MVKKVQVNFLKISLRNSCLCQQKRHLVLQLFRQRQNPMRVMKVYYSRTPWVPSAISSHYKISRIPRLRTSCPACVPLMRLVHLCSTATSLQHRDGEITDLWSRFITSMTAVKYFRASLLLSFVVAEPCCRTASFRTLVRVSGCADLLCRPWAKPSADAGRRCAQWTRI